jgi:hypothetical protein
MKPVVGEATEERRAQRCKARQLQLIYINGTERGNPSLDVNEGFGRCSPRYGVEKELEREGRTYDFYLVRFGTNGG